MMEDEDLMDLFAGLAMMGYLASGYSHHDTALADDSYSIAQAMIKAKYAKADEGIASVKPTRKKRVSE